MTIYAGTESDPIERRHGGYLRSCQTSSSYRSDWRHFHPRRRSVVAVRATGCSSTALLDSSNELGASAICRFPQRRMPIQYRPTARVNADSWRKGQARERLRGGVLAQVWPVRLRRFVPKRLPNLALDRVCLRFDLQNRVTTKLGGSRLGAMKPAVNAVTCESRSRTATGSNCLIRGFL